MLMNELPYLEDLHQADEVVGGTDFTFGNSTFITKDVIVGIEVTENFDITKNFSANVDITGNTGSAEGAASAFGSNTLAQVVSASEAAAGQYSLANGFTVAAAI